MGADEHPQGFRDGEGHQEIGRGQQQPCLLAFEPEVGVGLAALRTMPVVAGMIAVVKGPAFRTRKELAPQSRGAAGQDLFQDLPMPSRHGGVEALAVIGREVSEQLMNRKTFTTVAGGAVHHKLPMNSSSRF